jgi:hypothetical protein
MAFHGRSGRVALVESSDEYALGWMAYKLARNCGRTTPLCEGADKMEVVS